MFTDEQVKQIEGIIQTQLGNFNSPAVPTHFHNGWDVNQLDPATALVGFPVNQVADASVAPTVQSANGTFIFQVDNIAGTPHYYFWAYLVYLDQSVSGHTGTGDQIADWVSTQLN